MFRYGERVRDTVTGFGGKVTAFKDHYGRRPVQFFVETVRADGLCGEWFDENRLESIQDESLLESTQREENRACYIPCEYPKAELVEEISLGRTAESIEKNLSAILDAKA